MIYADFYVMYSAICLLDRVYRCGEDNVQTGVVMLFLVLLEINIMNRSKCIDLRTYINMAGLF